MPYRAMFYTIVTVALALLGITLWVATIQPMLVQSAQFSAAATQSGELPSNRHLRQLVHAILLLAMLLTTLLVIVGFIATWREWMRRPGVTRKRVKTKYVDAWKLAGERMQLPKSEGESGDKADDEEGGS